MEDKELIKVGDFSVSRPIALKCGSIRVWIFYGNKRAVADISESYKKLDKLGLSQEQIVKKVIERHKEKLINFIFENPRYHILE